MSKVNIGFVTIQDTCLHIIQDKVFYLLVVSQVDGLNIKGMLVGTLKFQQSFKLPPALFS